MYTGPHIIKDGLVFGYDTGYGIADNVTSTRFYPGKPTSNALETEANWIYLGTNITNPSDYPVPLPAEVNFQKGAAQGAISWSDACRNYADSYSAGTKITVSGWHMFHSTDTSLSMSSRDRLGWHYSKDGASTYGGTIYTATEWNKWYYFSSTFSSTGVTTNLRVEDGGPDYYRSSEDAAKTTQYYCNLQIEVGTDVVSPYIKGSRSSTASLIDLKETTDIDLSNVSFDSTGQPEFDGSSDHIDLGTVLNSYGSVSIELVFKTSTSSDLEMLLSWGTPNSSNYSGIAIGNWAGGMSDESLGVVSNGQTLQMWVRNGHTAYKDDNYHHAIVTLHPGQNRVFVDGIEQTVYYQYGSINTDAGAFTISNNQVSIGKYVYNSGSRLNGKLPLIKIYNKALSDAEVKQNYNACKNRFSI